MSVTSRAALSPPPSSWFTSWGLNSFSQPEGITCSQFRGQGGWDEGGRGSGGLGVKRLGVKGGWESRGWGSRGSRGLGVKGVGGQGGWVAGVDQFIGHTPAKKHAWRLECRQTTAFFLGANLGKAPCKD